jgi:hypothetical protein
MALIKPTIYANLVREKYEGKAVMRNFAVDSGELTGTTVGAKVSFPKWSTITDAEDMTNFNGSTDELTSVQLAQTASEATVKQIGKAIFVRDYDNVTALGNAIDEAAVQHGIVISRKVDADLATEALTTALYSVAATPTAITAAELNSTIGLFGDEQDVEEFAGIVINSLLLPSFRGMTEFVDMTKSNTTVGNGIIRRGLVGFFNGVPVYLSNKGTYDTTLSETITYVIKIGALGYMEKREIMVEEDRQPKKGGSDVVANLMYAVKLLKDDGVAILRKTVSEA